MGTTALEAQQRTDEAPWKAELAFCVQLSKSALVPSSVRGRPDDIFVVLQTAKELGIGPMLALRTISVIDGKPCMEASLVGAMILRSDACEEFRCSESTETQATYVGKRSGAAEGVKITYSIDDAKKAGLFNKQNWQKHTKAMLRARAATACGRAVFPDLVAGLYDEEEVEAAESPSVRIIPNSLSEATASLARVPEMATTDEPTVDAEGRATALCLRLASLNTPDGLKKWKEDYAVELTMLPEAPRGRVIKAGKEAAARLSAATNTPNVAGKARKRKADTEPALPETDRCDACNEVGGEHIPGCINAPKAYKGQS